MFKNNELGFYASWLDKLNTNMKRGLLTYDGLCESLFECQDKAASHLSEDDFIIVACEAIELRNKWNV